MKLRTDFSAFPYIYIIKVSVLSGSSTTAHRCAFLGEFRSSRAQIIAVLTVLGENILSSSILLAPLFDVEWPSGFKADIIINRSSCRSEESRS